jgi:hypothetical protein
MPEGSPRRAVGSGMRNRSLPRARIGKNGSPFGSRAAGNAGDRLHEWPIGKSVEGHLLTQGSPVVSQNSQRWGTSAIHWSASGRVAVLNRLAVYPYQPCY